MNADKKISKARKIALVVAVFPANIYMALAQVQVTANPAPGVVVVGAAAATGAPYMVGVVVYEATIFSCQRA